MSTAAPYPSAILAGSRRVRRYRGRRLLQIALPMGGIGAGSICLNGYGGLQDFSIRHAPANSAEADHHNARDAGFALMHLPELGVTRLVEGQFPPEKIYDQGLRSQGYNGGGHEGLPRFRQCTFEGRYPFGTVRLSDPEIPLEVSLTGFNPFIPLDEVNSGLPCAILEYTLRNKTKTRQAYQFSYHLSHLAQKGLGEVLAAAESGSPPRRALPRSQALPGVGVYFWNEAPEESPAHGSAALGLLPSESLLADPLIKARWFRGGWFDAISAIWREVSSGQFQPTGGLEGSSRTGDSAASGRSGGSILLCGELAPGERVTIPIAITWHFPNIGSEVEDGRVCCGTARGRPFYATRWKNASAVLDYLRQHYSLLRQRTQAFHDALFSSTLPSYVLDAVSANLGILKSPTVLRHEDGSIWAWEGCFCDRGCCPGSCTHVWNYAQAMPHLFPALERSLREQELGRAMDIRGHINFRVAPPGLITLHDFHAAADGQLGGVMKAYREWQISGDRDWLARWYPSVKRSLDFCIAQWDPRRVGLLEEPHHNTYDIEFWGADGMCSSFYLGALSAMGRLARDAGLPEDAAVYESLAQKGAEAMDERLFNGEYYQQQVQYAGLDDTSFVDLLARLPEQLSEEQQLLKTEGPKYQYGAGCLSDGVFGAWLARLCGLESPQSPAHIRQHLAAIFRYNFKPSLLAHANVQRPGYALGDEPGLLLCTWPKGGKPTLPFVYSDEVWTGIEYQVAAHLIAEGLTDEGLTLVHAARARYEGHKRNPWNEYECGSYYARAMSSYALLIALSGFRYAAPTRTLYLAPQLDRARSSRYDPFRCFFSTASGWGALTLEAGRLIIDLQAGELAVDTLQLTRRGQERTSFVTRLYHPRQVFAAGKENVIRLDDGERPES